SPPLFRSDSFRPATPPDHSVPILIVTAPAMAANSPASSLALTMAGEAPAASSTLAAMFIATSLVMHWTSGLACRIAVRSCPHVGLVIIAPFDGAGAGQYLQG